MQEQTRTPLTKGNAALRAGQYTEAIRHYAQVLIDTPDFGKNISSNLAMARKKYRVSRQGIERQRVAVCGWELAHNPAGRAYTLAMLYETFAEVEIIGCLFPNWGREIWEPIRETPIAKHSFIVEDESRFIEQAVALVAAHPYDIVHLSKPRAPNIFIGVLYKLIWDAKVLMDIDDEELAFVSAETSISIDNYLKQHGQLPQIRDLAGKVWTRIAVGLAKEFDGVTVSNPALQQRYGGEIVRHARDEKLYNPSPELKRESREKYGIPQDKKVVLFFGTPREHKGLIETAKAIAALGRKDILFAVVGDFPDPKLKEQLQTIRGVEYRFIGNQPAAAIPGVTAIGDLCLLLQDPEITAAQFQVPAKLSDAFAMGIPVLATHTPALADAFFAGALIPVTQNDLPKTMAQVLDDAMAAARLQAAGRRYFAAELSFAASTPQLQQAASRHDNRPLTASAASLARVLRVDWLNAGIHARSSSQKASRYSIDIVVPVFNALDDVKRCLTSLEQCQDGFRVRVIVVNDGSDDDTTQWLRYRCKGSPIFKLIEQRQNRGYTRAVNTGLRDSTADFVITQNSDTIVSRGWLKGMVRCMESDPKIGIVGPLSNAASWQNVPILKDETGSFAVNELPSGVDVGEMARLVADVSERSYIRLPFINGFCFMIRRAVIDSIGYMDEENFPIGYGEENDFCIRAADAGYILAVADDVYVFHAKSKSFGHEKRTKLSKMGTAALKRKHGTERFVTLVSLVGNTIGLDEVRGRISRAIIDLPTGKESKEIARTSMADPKGGGIKAGASILTVDMHGKQIELWPIPAYGSREYEVDPKISGPVLILPHQSRSLSQIANKPDIGIHLHLYYDDLLDEFAYFLKNVRYSFSLYVSVVNPESQEFVAKRLIDAIPQANVEVACFPNRGRDIGPLFAGFGRKIRRHELIAHIHSKRSLHNLNKADWRRQLVTNLFGSDGFVGGVVDLFQSNPQLGMVFPEYHHSLSGQISWGTNFSICKELAKSLNFDICEKSLALFPAGSMFWARSGALKRLFDLELGWADFPKEDGQVDGTIAHGIERLFGEVVANANFSIQQVKSDRPHNLLFYYPFKWKYSPLRSFDEIDLAINKYRQSGNGKQRKCVVYSALTGGYEDPVVHENLDENCDYLLFADSSLDNRGFWQIKEIPYRGSSPVRMALWVKTNPHTLLAGYDIAVWVDANVVIRGDIGKYTRLIEENPDVPLFGVEHPHRRCLYQEAMAVVHAKKDTEERVAAQINRYKVAGFPANFGLIETNLLVINLRHPLTSRVFEAWTTEIESGSHRDQLSLNYCLWKFGAKWMPVFREKETLRDSFDFAYLGHGRNSGYLKEISIATSKMVAPGE